MTLAIRHTSILSVLVQERRDFPTKSTAMGIPLTLRAIPDPSHLLTRLRTDRQLGTLFAELYSMGGGPFTWPKWTTLTTPFRTSLSEESWYR